MLMSLASRAVIAACISLALTVSAVPQPSEPMADSLRRLLDSIPTVRIPDSLGVARGGTIMMEGEGSVRVPPDTARIRVGVTSEGSSPTEVAQENATRMNSVLDAIKKAVGEPALAGGTVEIRTDAVTLTPVYAVDPVPPRGAQRLAVSGYRANNSVRISVREFDRRGPGFLAAIIDQASKVGANEVSGPEFLVRNDAKPLVEARVNAIENARTKAETYAKALNVRLGRVLMIAEAERGHRPMPMMASAPRADASPPIEPGTNELTARVTVVWELKQD